MAGRLNVSNVVSVMRSRLALGFGGTSVSKTGFSSCATPSSFVERVMQDVLHVGPIRGYRARSQLSRRSIRGHRGGRVQPWRPTSRVIVTVQQQKANLFEQKHL